MLISEATDATIAEAGRLIAAGQLVAFPTETVYGLGGDATNGEAVAAIFAAKGRPSFNPLIVHVLNIESARKLADFPELAIKLATGFWPGPLTLVCRKLPTSGLSELATAGLDTVAIRIPSHPTARRILAAAGCPVAAPSANKSGRVSPTSARHVAGEFADDIAMIVEGGAAEHGLESTVIDATGSDLIVLRPGAITAEEIKRRLGITVLQADADPDRPHSPGQLASHYAPRARLTLDATTISPSQGQLAFGPALQSDGMIINLSPKGDLIEAAANLFASLRAFDEAGIGDVGVMPIPHHGLGIAMNDRLRRAAAPRNP